MRCLFTVLQYLSAGPLRLVVEMWRYRKPKGQLKITDICTLCHQFLIICNSSAVFYRGLWQWTPSSHRSHSCGKKKPLAVVHWNMIGDMWFKIPTNICNIKRLIPDKCTKYFQQEEFNLFDGDLTRTGICWHDLGCSRMATEWRTLSAAPVSCL